MDKVIEKAKELKAALDETPEMKEYLKYKDLYENSEDVIELKHNIANLRAKGKLNEANNLQALYDNHPIVVNYQASKEALMELLKTIQSLTLGDFYELINIVLTGEQEDSLGAAAIIMDRYNDELKDFLIELMDKNPSNKSKKLLFDTFKLKWGTNRTAKNGMYIQEILKEARDWEKIKEFYSK